MSLLADTRLLVAVAAPPDLDECVGLKSTIDALLSWIAGYLADL
jgi:hypothetical protein